MSKLWGPLGWMTLHSISLIYPEIPSQTDKYIASRYLDLFADTISCIQCKSHFKHIYAFYKSLHPEFLNSRQDFALFIFRAHNTVNLKLDKPRPATVSECLKTLKIATSHTSLAEFRNSYLSYLLRNWSRDVSGDGMMIKAQLKEMIKINNEYWSTKDIQIPNLKEADVLTPIQKPTARLASHNVVISTVVGFRGGKLKLGKR